MLLWHKKLSKSETEQWIIKEDLQAECLSSTLSVIVIVTRTPLDIGIERSGQLSGPRGPSSEG
jgi:hypothetical protein